MTTLTAAKNYERFKIKDNQMEQIVTGMKIYIASSWKNESLVNVWANILRKENHEVDAFVDALNGRYVFHFSEIGDPLELDCINFLQDNRSKKAFKEDRKWLDWCNCCLLILPAGKSAHLEAGYAKGRGKKLIIWQEKFPKGEFDVMYGFADLITDSVTAVIECLQC
jgi:hypothetical protein